MKCIQVLLFERMHTGEKALYRLAATVHQCRGYQDVFHSLDNEVKLVGGWC